ncbi:glutathione-S-transferase-like protein [Encephalitozoon intestinalis ATCC 50506]|uniref:Protein MAK16 n=1 Tax=Encephalitozoon intestinalis (strain ATCC 50506) TaxID=876142 RepID=E0S9L9_ENCIT|nr:glutathione-S-transferase-like protein [Encephalitozoon intestinalis ATCC 50506]ADM12404.1 glutathione-S-transferase-like protein [Encephalitozoon intestinalis ATCC 50506]UTX46237.1 maintenance of killer protein 16 [Encephalitozoon intestinalis]
MSDESIWRNIGGEGYCSFKMKTEENALCRNKNNVTGLCDRFSCPLANSKYATVREMGEELFLFIKEPERVHVPRDVYEEIKLSSNYEEALRQIEENLEFWDEKIIHKCKQKLSKLTQYLRRLERFKEHGKTKYMVRRKKMNRREKLRALKTLNKINFEKNIGDELMLRLESGIYGTELKDRFHLANKAAVEREKKQNRKKRYVAELEESDGILEEESCGVEKKADKKTKKTAMKW